VPSRECCRVLFLCLNVLSISFTRFCASRPAAAGPPKNLPLLSGARTRMADWRHCINYSSCSPSRRSMAPSCSPCSPWTAVGTRSFSSAVHLLGAATAYGLFSSADGGVAHSSAVLSHCDSPPYMNRRRDCQPCLTQVRTKRLKLVCCVEGVRHIRRDLDGPSGLFGRVSSSTFQRPAGSLKVEVLGLHRYLSSTMERTKPRGCRA